MVTRLPTFALSSWNCTLATPIDDEAFAVTDTVPETVAPDAGAVIETVGGATALLTVMLTAALVVELPAVSLAIARRVCDPLAAVVVFHE